METERWQRSQNQSLKAIRRSNCWGFRGGVFDNTPPGPVRLRTQINLSIYGMIIMEHKKNIKVKPKSSKPKKASEKKQVNYEKRPKR